MIQVSADRGRAAGRRPAGRGPAGERDAVTTACAGLKVLDFSQGMAGSLATMILADNGAEVVKVEPPEGDWARGEPGFLMWNRGKQSLVLDLKRAEDREVAQKLARQVDVVVESFSTG